MSMTKRKTKVKKQKELKLDFTGKMTVIAELKNYGPIQWRINDKDAVLSVLQVILDKMGDTTSVDSYSAREGKTLKKMMDEI